MSTTPKYRNKFEARVAATVDPAFQYEAQRLAYTSNHNYLPDFIDPIGKRIIEMKGHFPAADRAKMKAIRQQYPDWHIEMVFQRAQTTISKSSTTTYAQWCERNGIAWRQA